MKLLPGSWTVKGDKSGRFILRGVRPDGSPVKLPCATRGEAERLAADLFRPTQTASVAQTAITSPDIDPEWGLPRVSAQTVQATAATLGRPAAPTDHAQPKDAPAQAPKPAGAVPLTEAEKAKKAEAEEVQKKRRKYAATFSELLGSGYAMGVGIIARKTRDPELYDVARPSPKHLTDLADCTAEGIKESFGDMEIGPWRMCFMLTVGVIVSTWMQSTRKPEKRKPELASVP